MKLLLVALIAILMSGCSLGVSGRQGQNSESINVTTCQHATTVGSNSCNGSVWKIGGGN